MLVDVETNANVADEVARRQIVRYMQTANSTNDKFVSGNNKTEKGKKRTLYAPQAERNSSPPAIISVELDEDEDVEWIWTHTADGKSVVTGYIITKRTDKPGQRMEVSDDSNRS
jgi:hypothetical protein